jgi:hypothetical protein
MSEQPPSFQPPSQPPGPPPSSPPPMGPPPGSPPPPFQPAPFQPQPAYGATAATVTNQKAVVSLVLGILGLVCCPILGPVALFISNQAKAEINASGGQQGGHGLAQGGLILGILGCIWLVLIALYFIVVVLAIGHAATTPNP